MSRGVRGRGPEEAREVGSLDINRRAVESDLLIYVNLNLVPIDGGHKSVAPELCDYESLRAHHEPETIRASDSYLDPKRSALNAHVPKILGWDAPSP